MIPNHTFRARRYVERSPQCKGLGADRQNKLVRGIAKLMSEAYKQGTADLRDSVLAKRKEL